MQLLDKSHIEVTGIRDIDMVWSQVEPMINKALQYSYGEIGNDDIYAKLKSKDMQLWICFENTQILSAFITEIILYPKKKICRIVTLGGYRMSEWLDKLTYEVERWAVMQNCDGVEIVGRKGWERINRIMNKGYATNLTTLYKELKHG